MTSPDDKEKMTSLLELDLANLQLDSTEDLTMEIEAGAVGGDKTAAAGLPELVVGEDGKVMKLVSQECIDGLLKLPHCTEPLPDYSAEALRRAGFTDEQIETVAMGFWAMQMLQDIKNDIIRQYLHKGYAYLPLHPDDFLQQVSAPSACWEPAALLPPLP